VNGVLRGRRGARIVAVTSGGAIPETADYKVVADPDDTVVGTVNEDWAIESMAGDIFLLGSTSWRIRRVEAGVVRVVDAQGAPPSVPFWLGEAPARTAELSAEVGDLRARVGAFLAAHDTPGALAWLERECGLGGVAAAEIVGYLGAAQLALGVLPTQEDLVFERFFDEAGGMQLVVHSPYGSRINRAWGLALRKRFCRKFNFELQAAATEDAIVLSLSTSHSFELASVARYLNAKTVREILVQAMLTAPMFAARWRWVAGISLALPRSRGGKKVPAPLQRMRADDLLAAVFPDQAACPENLTAEPQIPDHPLVNETIANCLYEAMDLNGLIDVLEHIIISHLNHPEWGSPHCTSLMFPCPAAA
jgi:ATP-dependent Lhr-like helicase